MTSSRQSTFPAARIISRYEAATKRVYVACGDDEESGGIAMIDAATNQRLDEVYKLGGEPESFQLEKDGPRIYVNVPPLRQIVVINRHHERDPALAVAWHRGKLPHSAR